MKLPVVYSVDLRQEKVEHDEAISQIKTESTPRGSQGWPHQSQQWPFGDRFQNLSYLGKGSYGIVYEARTLQSSDVAEFGRSMVALKKQTQVFRDVVRGKRILRELAILARLEHHCVMRLHDVFVFGGDPSIFDHLCFAMEIGDADLGSMLRKDLTLLPSQINTIFYNLLIGLKYIHSAGIYHWDLKPSNVLVMGDCTTKICDFGLARSAPVHSSVLASGRRVSRKPTRVLTGYVASRFYRAPEIVLCQRQCDEMVDVWSAGCIAAELTQMLEGVPFRSRGPLFPGTTCFPFSLTGCHFCLDTGTTRGPLFPGTTCLPFLDHWRDQDQMNVIFDTLGTPSETDIQKLERQDAQAYIRCFAPRVGCGLRERLPFAVAQMGIEMVEVIESMLCFTPCDRNSVDDVLNHKLFETIRQPSKETTAPGHIALEYDQDCELTREELQRAFAHEIRFFKSCQQEGASRTCDE